MALIQIGSLLTMRPGPAALAFTGVVICTLLSARSFDPRLLWDPPPPRHD
ncbi:MAG: paraquat-inducible protein A [Planctomycetota bacterium]